MRRSLKAGMCRGLRGLTRLQCPQLQELNLFGNRCLDKAGVFVTHLSPVCDCQARYPARPGVLLHGGHPALKRVAAGSSGCGIVSELERLRMQLGALILNFER